MDAQAPDADERRGKLRKVTGNRKQVLIRERLNGETRRVNSPSLATEFIGCQGERGELKHLSTRRKRK